LNFAFLDPGRYSFRHGVMGAIRRTINLIIALVLVALGCGSSLQPPETGRRIETMPRGKNDASIALS
jgi:hypothetical protein